MFLRQDLGLTVHDLATTLDERQANTDSVRVSPDEVEFHLDSMDPTIKVKDREVPATETSLMAIADLVSIPGAFLKRLDKNAQGSTKNALFTDLFRNAVRKDLSVTLAPGGIQDLREYGKEPIRQSALAHLAERVIGTGEAKIVRLVDEPHEFAFDVVAPEDFSRGVGGDRQVGDITTGGLRFHQNIKQGLAPSVQKFMFRLACTNGYENVQTGLKVDARGQSVEEVLAELESMAQLAFGQVEADIEHFYSLREVRVDNPERALRVIARERGLPDRSTMALMDLAAGEDLPDQPSMFDIVNLVTNLANSPQIRNDGGRLLLERAGGNVIGDHAARCSHCQQKVQA